MDQGSAVEGTFRHHHHKYNNMQGAKKPSWRSIFKRGTLKHFHNHNGLIYSIEWDPDVNLIGGMC